MSGFSRRLAALIGGAALLASAWIAANAGPAAATPTLNQVPGFGTNPGGLNMYSYLPANLAAKPALVVALHGCTQSANDYYADSGWPKYADLYGFAVVFAEQPSGSGLTAKCFDWGDTSNDTRGRGQALSVYQMVQYAESHYSVDPARVFLTGLSAGGGMTADLLADYPDVFAAGSVDSGPPAQCATAGITDSSCTSTNSNTKTPKQWGDLVRASDPGYTGSWPRVQVWNGAADYLVKPVALAESRDQWTDVWSIGQTPSSSATLTGNTTENIYNDAKGKPAVETFSIPNMGHGLAVHPGSAIDSCGATGANFLDYICSTYYSMKFFGLDGQGGTPPPPPPTTPTTPITPPTTSSGSPLPNCYTTDNVSQNRAGRSYFYYGGDSYAIGSNQDMGKYSSSVVSSLHQTSPGYWVVVPHC